LSRILVAAILSGIAAAVVWIVVIAGSRLAYDALGQPFVGGFFGLMPYGVATFLAPIIGGFCGGLISRRFSTVIGSISGYLVAAAALGYLFGGSFGPFDVRWAMMLGVLSAMGHLAGFAIRPERRPA
jgi:hypothetical protein